MLSETGNTVCTQHTNAAGTPSGSTKRGSNRGGGERGSCETVGRERRVSVELY